MSAALVGALALLSACGSDAPTESNFTPYINPYLGTWTAVKFGGQSLPQSTTLAPTPPARITASLKFTVLLNASWWTEDAQLVSAGPTFTPAACMTNGTSGATATNLVFVALTLGNTCDVNAPEIYTLTGDTLRTTHRGQTVLMVRVR